MIDTTDAASQDRLEQYFNKIGRALGSDERRASFAVYAAGLLSDAERKSMEPIAAQFCADPEAVDAVHQRLHHFITDSKWNDLSVRRCATQYAIRSLGKVDRVEAWIVDDTGMLKQGKHSVGVQRQYTGSAGKVTNCQIAVTLAFASAHHHFPVDAQLYLPECWANDPARRKEARIPDDVQFETKIDLAVGMITRAVRDALPKGIVLADAAYGGSSDFRAHLRELDLHFAVGIDCNTKVWRTLGSTLPWGDPISVKDLARELVEQGRFRRITWRHGTSGPLRSRFAFARVVPCHDDGYTVDEREILWLLCEWPEDEDAPCKFHLLSLPHTYRKRRLIRILKERYRTEQMYSEMKDELGFDHFEGRRWRGWHHHVSTVIATYCFVVAERRRRFPPSWSLGSFHHAHSLQA
jgi:SRSO17 transposase